MATLSKILSSIIFSRFEQEGPVPLVCVPEVISDSDQFLIAMKSISLLMGEQIYQEGKNFDLSYFGILPFPDIEMISLTYFFLIPDNKARGKARASTVSLLIHEKRSQFVYNNMKQLSILVSDISDQITQESSIDDITKKMLSLYESINDFALDLKPESFSPSRTIKILFTGLDASGKTSFLRAIKKQYSSLIGVTPTKGFKRSQDRILGRNLVEWDIGGQKKYRNKFLNDSNIYLFDTNLIFFLIDIRNKERFGESLDFFNNIIEQLENIEQFPPIVVCMHKMDPEIKDSEKYIDRVKKIVEKCEEIGQKFPLKFFQTSIFDEYSLIKSFSAGITAMSPNREMFEVQLKWFANNIQAHSILLLNVQSLILGSYSVDENTSIVSEMAAPHFQNLYRTFEEFHMLKSSKAVWKMEENYVYFYKFFLDENPLFLLCLTNGKTQEKVLDDLLDKFKEKIYPLLQTYL